MDMEELEELSDDVFDAIDAGDAELLAELLRRGGGTRFQNGNGITAVLWCLYNRKDALAEVFLQAGHELDLFEAAAMGREDRVSALLDANPRIAGARTRDGFTALHLAAYLARRAAVEVLIARGAPLDALAANPSRVQPLHSAAASRQAGIVQLLLDAGAPPDPQQLGGYTPLHSAVGHRDIVMTRALIRAGADPERAADDGTTPRGLAEESGQTEVLQVLASRGSGGA